MAQLDNIKSKINKLLKLKEGAEKVGSLEEAQLAAKRVRDLLVKYNLELADVQEPEEKQIGNELVMASNIIPFNKSHGKWLYYLYTVTAKFNYCSAVCVQGDPSRVAINIFGEHYNIQIVKDLSHQYAIQIIQLEKERWKTVGKLSGDKRPAFRRAYYLGAVNGLAHQFNEQNEELKKEHGEKVNELMVMSNQLVRNAVEEYFSDKGGVEKGRKSKVSSSAGAQAGFRDGKNMKTQGRVSTAQKKLS